MSKKIIDYVVITRKMADVEYLEHKVGGFNNELASLNSQIQKLTQNSDDYHSKYNELSMKKMSLKDKIKNFKKSRSCFEEEVMSYIENGYVLKGGVSVSRGFAFQALIKYDD
jgi:peptidoglycan hydrolase CwlO-like protein